MASPRLLLSRPDHLGDLLLSLAVAGWLRTLLPDCELASIVPPGLAPVAERCPAIDETLTAPFPSPVSPDQPDDWQVAIARLAPDLAGRFDIALIPRIDDPWSGSLLAAAGIPVRIGFDHPRTRPYLTHSLPVPDRLHVTRLATLVARAGTGEVLGVEPGVMPEPDAPWIAPTDADRQEVESVIAELPGIGTSPLIVVHPGAGWPLKSWSTDNWATVAKRLGATHGTRPLVTGGPSERDLVAEIVAACRGGVVDVAGRLSIGGLAALYQAADVVVANDSGPLHLAAAVGTPVVGLYGPAGPDEFGPWAPVERQRVVQVRLPCQPCRTMVGPPCGAITSPACLQAVTPDAVVTAASELLEVVSRMGARDAASVDVSQHQRGR